MRKLLKNKITWVVSGIVLLIIISITLFLVLRNKETKELKENTYTMYVSTNVLSKLTFKESYYECKKNKEVRVCSDYNIETLTHEYLDRIESDIDIKNKDILEVLKEIYNKSLDNNKKYNYIKLITNWDNKYSESDIKEYISSNKEVIIEKDNTLNEEDIIKELTKENETKTYIVKFETDGGSIVNSQIVKENELVSKPDNPSKEGYTFKSWQLNEIVYDFNTPVTSEITLQAIWERVESKPNTTTKPTNPSKPNNNGGNQGNNTTKPTTPTEPDKPTTPEKKLVYVKDAEEVRNCTSGYTLENGECVRKTAQEKKYICEKTELNGKCYIKRTETKIPICNEGDQYREDDYHLDYGFLHSICLINGSYANGYYQATFRYECNNGGTLIGDKCLEETSYSSYFDNCPSGQTQECTGYVSPWKDTRECSCVERITPTVTYTCGNLIIQENKCYRYE